MDDVAVEYMDYRFILFRTVAAPLGVHAFLGQMLPHGLRFFPEKIVGTGGDKGGGIPVINGIQNLQPGVFSGNILSKIIQIDTLNQNPVG